MKYYKKLTSIRSINLTKLIRKKDVSIIIDNKQILYGIIDNLYYVITKKIYLRPLI